MDKNLPFMDKTAWKRILWYAVAIANKADNLNGGKFMRHFYFRLIFSIIWLAAAVVSVVNANISFAALYAALGIVFLWSAYSIWKKEKDKDDDQKYNG